MASDQPRPIAKTRLRRLLVFVTLLMAVRSSWGAPPITAVAISPDGNTVVAGSQTGVTMYDWPDLEQGRLLSQEIEQVADLDFAPDGTLLAIAGGEPAVAGQVLVVHSGSGAVALRDSGHSDLVYDVAWDPSGASLATASLDHTVRRIDLDGGPLLRTYQGHSKGVTSVVFLSDSQLLTAGRDNNLRRWNVNRGELERSFNNHTGPVHDLVLRPQNAATPQFPMVCSVSDDRTIRFWAPTIGRMMRFARLDDSVPLAAAWSPDGRWAAVCTDTGELKVVDPDTTEIVQSQKVLDGWAYALAFHPDQKHVIVGGTNGTLQAVTLTSTRSD